jgi:hypothetical protein
MNSKKLFKNNRLQYGGSSTDDADDAGDAGKSVVISQKTMKEQLDAIKEQVNADINTMKELECLFKFKETQSTEASWRGLIVVDVQNGFIAGGSLGPTIKNKRHLKQADLIKMLYHINKDSYKVVCWSKDFHPDDHSSFLDNNGIYPSHCRDPKLKSTYQTIQDVLNDKARGNYNDKYTFVNKDRQVIGVDISYLFNGLNRNLSHIFDNFSNTHDEILRKLDPFYYPVNGTEEARQSFLDMHIRKDLDTRKFIIPSEIKNSASWLRLNDPLFVVLLKGQLRELDSNSPFIEHLELNNQIAYNKDNLLGTWLSIALGFLFNLDPRPPFLDNINRVSNDQALDYSVSAYDTNINHGNVPRVVLDVCGLVTNICVAQTVIQGIIAWLKRYSLCIPQIGFNVFIDLSVPLKMEFQKSPVNFYKPYNDEYDEQFPLNNIDKKRDTNENNETTDNLIDFYRNALQSAINLNKISETEMQKIKDNVIINIILAGFGPIKFDMALLQHDISTTAPGNVEQGNVGQGNVGQGNSGQKGGSAHNSTCNCNQCSATYRKKYLKYKKKYLEYK